MPLIQRRSPAIARLSLSLFILASWHTIGNHAGSRSLNPSCLFVHPYVVVVPPLLYVRSSLYDFTPPQARLT